MEKKLKSAYYEALVLEATLGIVVANREGEILLANPEAENLFAYAPGELNGASIEVLVPQMARKSHAAYHEYYHNHPTRRLMGEGRELNGLRKDGSTFPVEISLSSVVVEGERLSVAFVYDIAKRKQTSDALKESELRLSAVINNANDSIITIAKNGTILSINPGGCRLFGYSSDEMIGNNVRMLMPEPDKSAHDGYMANYHRTGIRKIIDIGREVTAQKKDGTLFPVLLSVNEVKLKEKTIYSGIIHDLTEQKKAEEQIRASADALEKMNEELEDKVRRRTAALQESERKLKESLSKEIELNELKSRFVSMASHEFRTPLSSVLSSASLLQMYLDKGMPEKQSKHIQRIQSSVQNLTTILNDFLSLEKLESGNVVADFTEVNFINFVNEIIEEFHPNIREEQNIEFDHQGNEILQVDPHLVKNIFFNLLSNAIKYSPAGKNVKVQSSFDGQLLKVAVIDQGMGIPLADQKHMFTRFFRATNATNISGTGLGLTIVKRYLDLMDGDIDFKSEEGQGTTFFFEIPQPTTT